MAKRKEQEKKTEEKIDMSGKPTIGRRTLLKTLAGIPVLGVFAFELLKKLSYDQEIRNKKNKVLSELGLENINEPSVVKSSSSGAKRDLLRVGIVGYGSRAASHANGLGFMHPEDVEKRTKNNTLDNWLAQENLNVALTGICDVFDLHAERGLATARNEIHPGNNSAVNLPVKRYRHYHEMLEDKDIDAVMIATPDFHHAQMTIDAAKAGKHVYCEKSLVRTEDEIYKVYDAVKKSDIVFQLGHQITKNVIYQQAKEILDRGILGKITLIETTSNRNTSSGAWIRDRDANGNPKPGNEKTIDWAQWLGSSPKVPFSLDRYYNWTKWFDYGMGLISQLFTHEYDAVNQILRIGIPKSAVSLGGIYYWKDGREIPDVLQCVFDYPSRDLTLMYSASLANSRQRGRVFMGHDASMELGSSMVITADNNSTRYKELIKNGIIETTNPMISVNQEENVDAVTSATSKYYSSRGLTTTSIKGQQVDLTYLHIKEWIDCIRNGEVPTANIERAFEESITCVMANKSYLEKRRVEWDSIKKKII